MDRFRRAGTVVALVAGLWAVSPAAVLAGECSAAAITARGEPSAFEWVAKTKARANWRSRVRATKQLGAAYSTWTRAEAREERCDRGRKGIVCAFTAIPCL